MIELLIFHFHVVGFLYAFTKNWQQRSLKDGFLSVMVLCLVFAIGWAITGTVSAYIYPDAWNTMYFNRDTLSLVLLFIPEIVFFYYFILRDKVTDEEKQLAKN